MEIAPERAENLARLLNPGGIKTDPYSEDIQDQVRGKTETPALSFPEITPERAKSLQSIIAMPEAAFQEPEVAEPKQEMGFFKSTVGDVAGGIVDAAEQVGRAGRALPGGDIAGEEGTGISSKIIGWATKFKKENPWLDANPNREGFSRWFHEGVRSAAMSLASRAPGAAAGAAIGSVVGAGPVGTFLGGLVGYATTGGTLYGLGEFDQTVEEAVKAGVPRDEAIPVAVRTGLYEGGFEFLSDLITAGALGAGAKPLIAPAAKDTLKRGVATLFKTNVKDVMKRTGAIALGEVSTEMATAGLQAEEMKRLGIGDDSFTDAAIHAFGPSLVASMIFGGVGEYTRSRVQKKAKDNLKNPEADIKDRAQSALMVHKAIKPASEPVADKWLDTAMRAIEAGEAIDLDTPIETDPELENKIEADKKLAEEAVKATWDEVTAAAPTPQPQLRGARLFEEGLESAPPSDWSAMEAEAAGQQEAPMTPAFGRLPGQGAMIEGAPVSPDDKYEITPRGPFWQERMDGVADRLGGRVAPEEATPVEKPLIETPAETAGERSLRDRLAIALAGRKGRLKSKEGSEVADDEKTSPAPDLEARNEGQEYVFHRGQDPRTSTAPVVLAADDKDRITSYGEKEYAIPKSALANVPGWVQRYADKYYRDQYGDDYENFIPPNANPDDIVNSADVWDDADFVASLWQNNEDLLLGMRDSGIVGFKTNDGAVIFPGEDVPVEAEKPPIESTKPTETQAPIPGQGVEPEVAETTPKQPVEAPETGGKEPWKMGYDELRGKLSSIYTKEDIQQVRGLLSELFPEQLRSDHDAWGIRRAVERGDEVPRVPMTELSQRHKALIEKARSEGKPVPREVLAEYPDLKKPEPAPEPTKPATSAPETDFGEKPQGVEETGEKRKPEPAQTPEDMAAAVDEFFASDLKLTATQRQKLGEMRNQLEAEIAKPGVSEETRQAVQKQLEEIDKRLEQAEKPAKPTLAAKERRQIKDIDLALKKARTVEMDFAYDMAINDKGDRVRQVEAKIKDLEEQRRQALQGAAPSETSEPATPSTSEMSSKAPEPKEPAPKQVSGLEEKPMPSVMLGTKETTQTSSGRTTTPFPKVDTSTPIRATNTAKRVHRWLQRNAVEEAESRGDKFNARVFRNETIGKEGFPQASVESMNEYLFGDQPPVVPSALKDLAPEPKEPSPIVSRVENAFKGRERSNEFVKIGQEVFPEIRLQEAEEAGMWAYQVAKGEATQKEFDAWKDRMRRENRTREKPAPAREKEDLTTAWDHELTQTGRRKAAKEAGYSDKVAFRLSKTKWRHISEGEKASLESVRDRWEPKEEAAAPTPTPAPKDTSTIKAEDATADDLLAEWDRQAAEMETAEAEPTPEPKETPVEAKEGDRVVLKNFATGYDGRHGTILKADKTTWTMAPVMGGQAQKREDIRYKVKTDSGYVVDFVSPTNIEPETGEAPVAKPDIEVNPGEWQTPEQVKSSAKYAREQAKSKRAAAQRARKPERIAELKRSAERFEEAAKKDQAIYDAWAEEHAPEELKKAETHPTGSLDDYGLAVEKTTTKNGKQVWQVSGNTKEHMQAMKAAGGRWYGPKKVWSFYNADPTQDILDQLPKKETPTRETPPVTPAESEPVGEKPFFRESGPAPARPAPAPTASEKAGETVDHIKNAIDKFKEINKILGEEGALSGKEVDMSKYELIKPLLQEAWDEIMAAGKSAREFVQVALQSLSPKGRPYFEKFVREEVSHGPDNARRGIEGENAPTDDQGRAAGEEPGPVSGIEEVEEVADVPDESGERDDGSVQGEKGSGLGQTRKRKESGAKPDKVGRGIRSRSPERVGRDTGNVPGVLSKGTDYVIPQGGLERKGGWKTAAKNNLDAIELYKKILSENRPATKEEQETLAKYVGWGASELANNMFPGYAWAREVRLNSAREGWGPLVERLTSLLTADEIKAAAKSTQNAHYTSEGIIRGIYKALKSFGFDGGKLFDPGSGISHFAGLIPRDIRKNTFYTGIEMDPISAGIAKLLYPNHRIVNGDFTKELFPKDFFDAAAGNPPFAPTKILADPEYRKQRFSLHNYFFAKSIDRIRPGGVLAFVTSHYTMDAQSKKVRDYLSKSADFIGAIRLPQTAFKENAGTEVVTDVIFLKKRVEGEVPAGEAWLDLAEVEVPEGTALVNEYFANHPEMVLGRHSLQGSMRAANEYTVLPADEDIESLFNKAVGKLPKNVYSPVQSDSGTLEEQVFERDYDPKIKKEGGVYLTDKGRLNIVDYGSGVSIKQAYPKLSKTDEAWLKDYVALRDVLKSAHYDQLTDGEWEKSLKKLQTAYRKFTKKHGRILEYTLSTRKQKNDDGDIEEIAYRRYKNNKLLSVDTEGSKVAALESIDEDGQIVEGKVLSERTIRKPEKPKIKTIGDALAVSLNERGHLDISHVAQLIGLTEEQTIESLGDIVYEDPSKGLTLSDEYLSGNVVKKLKEAQAAAEIDAKYKRNVEALKKVQPSPLGPKDITVTPGGPWIPTQYLSDFGKQVLHLSNCRVDHYPASNTFEVKGRFRPQGMRGPGVEFGTSDRGPNEVFEAALNSRAIKITRTDPDTKQTWTDTAATTAANEAVKALKERFGSWVWEDGDRAKVLLEIYNEQFNNLAPRHFDGSHLTLPGASSLIKLYDHQKRAIWRIIQTGNSYLAHSVGAGKTFVMISAGMEMKRLGMISKPLYVVPKHMLGQFAREFNELYPMAHVMVADEKNFHTENRRRFISQATLNSPDAIVIPHSSFGLLSLKEETIAPVRDDFIAQLQYAWEEMRDAGEPHYLVKQMEKRVEQAEQKFNSLIVQGDRAVAFEEMGVDYVFVDEAHEFRKLDYISNQKIKGIDPVGSRKSTDLYIKTLWLEKQNPGRSHTFASGTPITNTIGELYSVMRFFNPKGMEEDGIDHFDAWASNFARSAVGYEMNTAGQFKPVERFSKFINIPELMSRVRQFMDVLTMSQLGSKVKLPNIKGGKPEIVASEPIPELKSYQTDVLQPRIEASERWKPSPSERGNPDPLINIITDGRLASIDMRFVQPVPNNPGSKLNKFIDGVIETYNQTKDNEYLEPNGKKSTRKGGVQVCFYNHGFGANVKEKRGFDARAWVMERLKEAGIPTKDVAWIDDYKNAAKKEALFRDLRNGKKRILFGSAKKMGTGMNIQTRLSHLHYLDPPWYPSDVEQPLGRIIRQGNQNEEVDIRWYATKGSYDATMWQLVAMKSRFIEKAFLGEKDLRTMEDVSETSQYEMASAIATGDERVIRLVALRTELERYANLHVEYTNDQRRLEWKRRDLKSSVQYNSRLLEKLKKMNKHIPGGHVAFETGTIDGKVYDKREQFRDSIMVRLRDVRSLKNADEEYIGSITAKAVGKGSVSLDIYREVRGRRSNGEPKFADVTIRFAEGLSESWDPGEFSPTKVINFLNSLGSNIDSTERTLRQKKEESAEVEKRLGAPFAYEREYMEAVAEVARLERELADEGSGEALEMQAISEMSRDEAAENRRNLVDSFIEDVVTLLKPKDTSARITIQNQMDEASDATYIQTAYEKALPILQVEHQEAFTEDFEEKLDHLREGYIRRESYLDYPAVIGNYPDFRESGIRFSRHSAAHKTPRRPVRAAAVRTDVNRVIGKEFKGLEGLVEVVQSETDLPADVLAQIQREGMDGQYNGLNYRGKTYIVADNLSSRDAGRVQFIEALLGHEGRHWAFSQIIPNAFERKRFFRQVADKYKQEVQAYMDEFEETDKALAAEEVFASQVREGKTGALIDRFISKVMQWVRKVFPGIHITRAEARNLIERAEALMAGERETIGINQFAQPVRYKLKEAVKKITDNPAFVRWFGKSKVVDENGEPLVVYHSTDADAIDVFRPWNSAKTIYFAFTPEAAREAARGKARIEPVYLKATTPVNTKNTPMPWGQAEDNIQVAEWRDQGYDSVYVKDEAGVSIAVFHPTQIKSIYNTTFDPNNPDIRFTQKEKSGKITSMTEKGEGRIPTVSPKKAESRKVIKAYLDAAGDDSISVPDGWYIHGRTDNKNLEEAAKEHIIETTNSWDWADWGKNGRTYAIKPKKTASVLDFSSQTTSDIQNLINQAVSQYKNGTLLGDIRDSIELSTGTELNEEAIGNAVIENFIPEDIGLTAGAYDANEWIEWLLDTVGPVDFVITPDGGVVLNYVEMDVIHLNKYLDKPLPSPSRSLLEGERLRYQRKPTKEATAFDKEYQADTISLWDTVRKIPAVRNQGWKEGNKRDFKSWQRLLSVPSHFFHEIASMGRVYNAAMENQDNRNRLKDDILKGADETYHTQALDLLRKQDRRQYLNLKKYLKDHDQNQIGYRVVKNPDTEQFELYQPGRKKPIGKFDKESDAVDAMIRAEGDDYLKSGATEQAANALMRFRRATNNGFDILFQSMDDLIKHYKETGQKLPTETVLIDGKRVEVNLKMALAKMGDMRGYYFPRIREPGRYVGYATKKGVNPIRKHFDYETTLDAWQIKMQHQGYKVTKDTQKRMPEDVFEMAGQVIAQEAIINEAFSRIRTKSFTLEDFGLEAIDRRLESGKRDFMVRGPTTKETNALFKRMGGRFFPSDKGGARVWHFENPGANFESRLAKAIAFEKAAVDVDLGVQSVFAKALVEQVANVIKGRGVRQHMIARRDATGLDVWEGYEEDPAIALAKYARGLAAGEAKKIMAKDMLAAFTGTDISWSMYRGMEENPTYEGYLEFVENRRVDPVNQSNAFKEGKTYIEHMLRNDEAVDRLTGSIKGLAVMKYLSGRVSAPLVNLTALVTSVPASMNGFGNIPLSKTFSYLSKASRYYKRYAFGDKASLPKDVRQLFDEIHDNGWHNAQYNREALAVLKSKAGRGMDRVIDWGMIGFGATEKLNRVATIAGAYLGLKDQGKMDHDEMLELAKKISDQAHATYGKANWPLIARGTHPAAHVMKAFYVFKTFSHNYLLTMKDLWGDGWNPKHAKAFTYMAVSPAILAGAGGMVGWGIIMSAIAKAFDIDDPEEDIYAWLDANLGASAERFARFGAFGLIGINLKGSLEIGVTDLPTNFKDLLGAPGSVIGDVYEGGKSILKGDVAKGIERIAPLAISGPLKAYRESTEGLTTRTNAPLFYGNEQVSLGPWEAALRSLAFNPARIAGVREELWSDTKTSAKWSERKRDINARIKKFYLLPAQDRTKDRWAKILELIMEYNERVKRTGAAQRGVATYITAKSIRQSLRTSFKPSRRERFRAARKGDLG
jgi:N12 class adenine-specific DNA methylase